VNITKIGEYVLKSIKLVLILFAIVLSGKGYSQLAEKLYVELNVMKYAKNLGLFTSEYYKNEFSYLNGFNIGYEFLPKLNFSLGVRNFTTTVNLNGGFSGETTNINGMEFNMGCEYASSEKKLYLSYKVDFFGEFSKLKGTFWNDYPPTYEINNYRNFYGLAPKIKVNFRLIDKVNIVLSSGFRLGYVKMIGIELTNPQMELYHNQKYWLYYFVPLNALSIKFIL